MTPKRTEAARKAASDLGDIPKKLAALDRMTVGQLADQYRDLYGEPTRTRNKPYLVKRLAWRIQELAEGGLSRDTLSKVAALGDELPERWRQRHAPPVAISNRDPRLPAVGTVLTRVHDGRTHEVTVRDDGFEYRGEAFRSLSAIARKVSGTPWNGFSFFGLPTGGAK